MLKRERLHGKLKSSPDDINLEQNYKAVRNKVVSGIGKAKLKNIRILDASLFSDIGYKNWWKIYKILNNGQVNNLNNTPLLDGTVSALMIMQELICLTRFFCQPVHFR